MESTLTSALPPLSTTADPLPDIDDLSFAAYLLETAAPTATFAQPTEMAPALTEVKVQSLVQVASAVLASTVTWWIVLIAGPLIVIAVAAFFITRPAASTPNPAVQLSANAGDSSLVEAPSAPSLARS